MVSYIFEAAYTCGVTQQEINCDVYETIAVTSSSTATFTEYTSSTCASIARQYTYKQYEAECNVPRDDDDDDNTYFDPEYYTSTYYQDPSSTSDDRISLSKGTYGGLIAAVFIALFFGLCVGGATLWWFTKDKGGSQDNIETPLSRNKV